MTRLFIFIVWNSSQLINYCFSKLNQLSMGSLHCCTVLTGRDSITIDSSFHYRVFGYPCTTAVHLNLFKPSQLAENMKRFSFKLVSYISSCASRPKNCKFKANYFMHLQCKLTIQRMLDAQEKTSKN